MAIKLQTVSPVAYTVACLAAPTNLSTH